MGKTFFQRGPEIADFSFEMEGRAVEFLMLREDLLDPIVSGNKFRKIGLFQEQMVAGGFAGIASCGGPFSNHLHALARAGYLFGFSTKGLVPGKHFSFLSPTLQDCQKWGMELEMVSREEFAEIRYAKESPEGLTANMLWKGEGGYSEEMYTPYQLLDFGGLEVDEVHVGVGSGGTCGGLLLNESLKAKCVVAYPCSPNSESVFEDLMELEKGSGKNLIWVEDHLLEAYGKISPDLLDFVAQFKLKSGVKLDPIYTSKMMRYAVRSLGWGGGVSRLFVHTGGLQGWNGMKQA